MCRADLFDHGSTMVVNKFKIKLVSFGCRKNQS